MKKDVDDWILPPLTQPLESILVELRGMSRGGLDEEKDGDQEEVKGLKFIANKLTKLFERHKRLKYNHISKVLIENFSSEANDSRNIKRRVYDAINVMVAAGLYEKVGEMLEKKESEAYRERVESMKIQMNGQLSQKQMRLQEKKKQLNKLLKRKQKLTELHLRNKKMKKCEKIVSNPIIINPRETRSIKMQLEGETIYQVDFKKSRGRAAKNVANLQILKDEEYLQYL